MKIGKYNKAFIFYLASFIGFVLVGCNGNYQPSHAGINNKGKTTLGVVQKSIKKGMSSAEVIEVLGSPNMVTQDENSNEVWVYDKVFTEVNTSNSKAGVWLLVVAGSESSASRTTSQKSLTIIIKFDNNKVQDFSYRSTTF